VYRICNTAISNQTFCARNLIRGRILGRNCNKSIISFLPCYSQSPLLTEFTTPRPRNCGLKSQDYAQKLQRNCRFMNSASVFCQNYEPAGCLPVPVLLLRICGSCESIVPHSLINMCKIVHVVAICTHICPTTLHFFLTFQACSFLPIFSQHSVHILPEAVFSECMYMSADEADRWFGMLELSLCICLRQLNCFALCTLQSNSGSTETSHLLKRPILHFCFHSPKINPFHPPMPVWKGVSMSQLTPIFSSQNRPQKPTAP
jgi:hypothetical protein